MNATSRVFYPGWATMPELFLPYHRGLAPEAYDAVDFGFFDPAPRLPSLEPEAVAALTVRPRCVVFGCSLGSLHALEAAAYAPERVKALVIISGFSRFSAAPGYAGQPDRNIRSMKLGLRKTPELVLENFFKTMATPSNIRFKVPAPLNVPRLAAGLELLLAADLRGRLGEIQAPTLILHGEQDAVVDVASARYVADHVQRAELKLFPGAGHGLVLTHQRQCVETIASFLSAHDIEN